MSAAADTRLALKIDVDTHDGLARGVQALAGLLASHGVHASFFVVCGPDRMGRRLARLRDPRFVAKLVRTRVIGTYPLRTLVSGLLLPARRVAGAFPGTLARLVADGHEVGVHGYDHARWQDRLPRLSPADVREDVTRASDVMRGILGRPPAGFAAPGWRCTAESLAAVDEAGFAYRSDTRGSHPYRPAVGSRVFRAPEIPTTWPTLDEVYGPDRRSPSALAEHWTSLLRPGALNVHTIHAELEGGAHLPVLDELIARAKSRCRFVRLADEVAALGAAELPVCEVREGAVPGRAMPVALQCG